MTENQKLREALSELMSIVSIHQKATGNNFAWAEMDFAREALALPTAEQVDDINVAESFTSVTKTAAPVGERERFEKWASREGYLTTFEPNAMCSKGLPVYKDPRTHAAWWAWQARSALSAGDAVDAQMYRWLMDNCTLGIKQNGVGWSLNTTACIAPDCIKDVGATIDAAMRKGQL